MELAGYILLAFVAVVLALAAVLKVRLGLRYRQALAYLPFKFIYRIQDRDIREASNAPAPVIYVICHQSRLDPALMLALLPPDTLHILDEASARSGWMEPWRELARTIPFNPAHLFVSRRLVRLLKGKSRLAVYLPDAVEPDPRTFRLYRAVTRMAARADARIVPIFIGGARHLPFSLAPPQLAPRRWFPKLTITALPPLTVPELMERPTRLPTTASIALLDRMAQARFVASDPSRSLFRAVRDSADCFGASRIMFEDVVGPPKSYRDLLAGARALGRRFMRASHAGDAVGLMLPNSAAATMALLGLLSGGRAAAMINYSAGPASVTSGVRTAVVRTVLSSRAFVEKADLSNIVEALEKGGAKLLWLEDLQQSISPAEKLLAGFLWRKPLYRQDPERPAVMLLTSGSEGEPKAVVLSNRNLVANSMQVASRVAMSSQDRLLGVLPTFHAYGLTGGVILPLLLGIRTFLYPSPLHAKIIPEVASRFRPTIMFGTDTFLAAYARSAKDGAFSTLRLIVSGAEAVRPGTRRLWRERFGKEIVEGYGLTEASPVVAMNSLMHNREGTVGRLLPGIAVQIEPVDGISEGGRLWISGPNVMAGYMASDRPGELQPPAGGWHDTGDIVTADREGNLIIRGRLKRFAKIAGEMVSLGAIEMQPRALWPEEDHAVVSVPDQRRGERIVLVTTAADADMSQFRIAARSAGLAEIMFPDEMVKVAEIPKLATGKTDYVGARKLAIDRLGLVEAA